MAYYDRTTLYPKPTAKSVNTFATQVYAWMTLGLLTTALVAFGVIATGLFKAIMPFWWLIAFGTFGISVTMSSMLNRLKLGTLAALFLSYSALEGLFFGTLLPGFAFAFGGGVIWTSFLTAAALFTVSIVYGLVSKSDMTSLGRILMLGLFGLIGISLVQLVLSFFMPVTGLTLIVSYLGLALFVGLTAYDARQIRNMSAQVDGYSALSCKLSVMMALKMYMNVVMIFWYLLQIFASSSNNRR